MGSQYEAESLRMRLAKLQGNVATIYVGGQTKTEIKHKKVLVENALHAVKACFSISPTKQSDRDNLNKEMMKLLDYQECRQCKVLFKDGKEYCASPDHVEYNQLKAEFLRLQAI